MIALLDAERRKLTSLRGPVILLGIILLLAAGGGALVLTSQPAFDPIGADIALPLTEAIRDDFLVYLLGALVVTTDLRFGGAVQGHLGTPNRLRLVAAKLLTALIAGVVAGVLSAVFAFAIGFPLLAGRGVDTGSAVADPVFWGRVATATAVMGLMAVCGAALALALRSLVAVLLVFIGMSVLEYVGPGLLPGVPWLGQVAERSWLHVNTAFALGPGYPAAPVPFWAAGLILLGWMAAFVLAAAVVAVRREVT